MICRDCVNPDKLVAQEKKEITVKNTKVEKKEE